MEEIVLLLDHFQKLIEEKHWKTLKEELNKLDDIQIADLIEELPEDEEIIIFRLLPRNQAKEVFQQLSYEKQEDIIEKLAQNSRRLSNLLNDIEPDDRTALFEELPGEIAQRLIQYLSSEEKNITLKLLGYPEDSIGRLMTPEYIAIKSYYTVTEAFKHIRKFGHESETLNIIYIVDKDWKLVDDLRIRELILAEPEQKISDLMDNKFIALNVLDDQETAIKTFKDYDLVALPVINDEGILLGIVTFDDIMDVAEEESTEDFHKFGAFQESISNPLKENIFILYKSRIVWLFALIFVNLFSSAVISGYENVIQKYVSLVMFLPLLIGSGGNAGSQTATLMIRSLALGEVRLSDWYKVMFREILISLLLGITMAIGIGIVASIRSPEIIIVVTLSMILVVLIGSLIGILFPFILTKMKLDPATASAPLIASLADIIGVTIYLGIAKIVLGI